ANRRPLGLLCWAGRQLPVRLLHLVGGDAAGGDLERQRHRLVVERQPTEGPAPPGGRHHGHQGALVRPRGLRDRRQRLRVDSLGRELRRLRHRQLPDAAARPGASPRLHLLMPWPWGRGKDPETREKMRERRRTWWGGLTLEEREEQSRRISEGMKRRHQERQEEEQQNEGDVWRWRWW